VGASNGSWSESITQDFPGARYHLFEPLAAHVPEYVERLPAVLGAHPHFTLLQVALGGHVGQTTMHWFPNYYASTTLPMDDPGHTVRPIQVPVTTLDYLVGAGGLPCPNLLKIDSQGSELIILEGAQQVLPQIDVLLLETWVWRGYEGKAPLLFDLVTWLAERHFFLWDIAGQYRDHADVLTGVDCFFVNTQTMVPYLDSRAYHPTVETEASRLKKVLTRAREDNTRLAEEMVRLRAELGRTIDDLALARGRIEAMEGTTFWKMRRVWFQIKRGVGFPGD
jgi:FkbM family methyltransferase